jgi:hypothetical protein
LLIPHDGVYWIVVSGDRTGVTGAYTFVATATPGPLEIGPAAKLVMEEADKWGDRAKGVFQFSLFSNFPNPFNAATTINYAIPEGAEVRMVVYDLGGRQVRVLVEGDHPPGWYTVVWEGRDAEGREVASGVYFYRLEVGNRRFIETKRMLLVR